MIVLHWTTALLVVAAYLTSEGGPRVRTDPPVLHMTLGVAVLALLLPRLVSRFVGGVPPVENPHGRWLDVAARIGHWALYGLLAVIPLTGWYTAARLGLHVSFFGLALPALTTPVEGRPGMVAELHQLAGNAILILAGVHALLALWHQFILKDGTLERMSPV
jgi:cytochrome b561